MFNRTKATQIAPAEDRHRLMVDLEAAQRRNPYAAGRGDGHDRSRRRRPRLARRR